MRSFHEAKFFIILEYFFRIKYLDKNKIATNTFSDVGSASETVLFEIRTYANTRPRISP